MRDKPKSITRFCITCSHRTNGAIIPLTLILYDFEDE